MDILVSFKDNWYPVQNIHVNAGVFTIKTIAGQLLLKRDAKVLWLAQRMQDPTVAPADIQSQSNGQSAEVGFNAQGYAQLSSADLARKIQQKQAKIEPEQSRVIIKELEQKLAAQIEANRKIEAKCYELDHRTTIAEQRLQVIYRFLKEMGMNQQDIFRRRV